MRFLVACCLMFLGSFPLFFSFGFSGLGSTAFAGDASFAVRDAVHAEWYVDVEYGRIPVRGAADELTLSSHVVSPDGRRAAFLTKKGDLKINSVCVTLHPVTLTGDGRSVSHRELARLCSNSNNPAISSVRWVLDNRIAFIGEEPGKASQIMSVNIDNDALARHTAVPGDKLGFDMNADGVVVFGVIAPPAPAQPLGEVGPGYIVQNETFSDLMGIDKITGYRPVYYYVKDKGEVRQLSGVQTQYSFSAPFISVSPSGHFAVVATAPRISPAEWSNLPLRPKAVSGATVHWSHLELVLIDLRTNARYAISGAPMASPYNDIQIVWDKKNGRLFALDQFLGHKQAAQLSSADPKSPALFEFSLTTKQITRLIDAVPTPMSSTTSEDKIVRSIFNAKSGRLMVQRGEAIIQYHDTANGWRRAKINGDTAHMPEPAFTLAVEQYVDQPAQMFATIPKTGERIAVGEINVGVKQKFNPPQVYAWTDESGRAWNAGLILPADAPPGVSLPLIIQTHGFSLHEFVITGPRGSSAGFSGQALASAGFAVLTVGPPKGLMGMEEEFEVMSEGFHSAIEALAEDGIIDPQRVGVIAWSRSGLWLQHALAFHGNLFKAAIVSDAGSFGRFHYIFAENWPTAFQRDYITQNKIPPFSEEALDIWQERDPVIKVGAFTVPLRLNDFDKGHPLWWEAYVAMKHAGEPVEYYHLPDAPHNPVQPEHQLWIQSTTIDWFRFWLKGEENPDPLDPNQYGRWRKMRKALGRVESRLSPALPHQTVHAVFPHTAFRCSSRQGMRRFPARCRGDLV